MSTSLLNKYLHFPMATAIALRVYHMRVEGGGGKGTGREREGGLSSGSHNNLLDNSSAYWIILPTPIAVRNSPKPPWLTTLYLPLKSTSCEWGILSGVDGVCG